MIPYDLPDAYRIEADIQPTSRQSIPELVLPVGDREAPIVLDGFASFCAIHGLDGKPYHNGDGNESNFKGPILTSERPTTIIYDITQNSVKVAVKGATPFIDWEGDPARLPNRAGPRRIVVRNWTKSYTISRLVLTPLPTTASPEPN